MKPQEKKLLELLSGNDVTFFIPPYQRNYEWEIEQCHVFWDDLVKVAKSNLNERKTEHFFGSITYFQTEPACFGDPYKLILIDGQQRITTTMLFLMALRDSLSEDSAKNFINSKYLKNNNITDEGEYKIKLKQVESDWKIYKKLVMNEDVDVKEKDSDLYRNYLFFKNKFKSWTKKTGKSATLLMEKGLNFFSVITLELQPTINPWENPQEIFESMNSIGKPLSLADLVRNYLLLGKDADTQENWYRRYWLKMEKMLPGSISDFIRDFMQGITGTAFKKATESNYKELYSQFKTTFTSWNAEKILKQFADYSTVYACIVLGNSTGNAKIDALLCDLRTINVTTAYSFLLMLLRRWKEGDFSSEEIIEILDVFKIYTYRRRIMKINAAENKGLPKLVNKLDTLQKAKNKRNAMFEVVSKQDNSMRLPNDVEIARELETMNFYNFSYCRLILAMAEEAITKNRPDLSDKNLQTEHIMPQKLNEEWEKSLGEDYEALHQAYVNTLGNLTLIRHNQQLGNKSFTEKQQVYKNNSGLQIAKTMITDSEIWNEESINKREKWLADVIMLKVFPIPESMRRTNNFTSDKGHLSFLELQLIGHNITFIADPSYTATVISNNEVEFEGKKWKLSTLTRELFERKGKTRKSGSYRGAEYWMYDGIKLADII